MRFKDKICLVTGGGSGIGRATCIRLAQEGGQVVVIDRDLKGLEETIQLIHQNDGEALSMETDIAHPEQILACVEKCVQKFGKIDVLVNDAAIMTFTPIVDLSIADWEKLMAVNLRSVFLFCKYCLPHMQQGAVVNVSSVHAHETTANVVPYAASKGAIEAFTRGLSREYPPTKARFNAVAPGAIDTPMLWANPNIKSGKEKITGMVGKPENVAAAICFLASDEAVFINGASLVVDGGRLDVL